MNINIITIFPELLKSFINTSIISKAREKKLVNINLINLRNFAVNKHNQVDDIPYGGGPGMIMKPEPFFSAVASIKRKDTDPILLTTPQGERLNQDIINCFIDEENITVLCPRYEGVDERVRKNLATREISVGDYVLSGGEVPAMVLIDAITRKVSGVLGSKESLNEESFTNGLLEYPQYTRPDSYKGMKVPDVLLSGNHGEIKEWRKEKSIERTKKRRPDLLKWRFFNIVKCYVIIIHLIGKNMKEEKNIKEIPNFSVGDTIKVKYQIFEGGKERQQTFQGVVIARKGAGANETFTIRKIYFGVGVEKIYRLKSHKTNKIEIINKGKVKRAKLYYLRDRVGKKAKVKEKREKWLPKTQKART